MNALHPRTPDLTEERFGRLTVVSFSGYQRRPNGSRSATWQCACDCGGTTTVRGAALRNGNTKSCGCSRRAPSPDGGAPRLHARTQDETGQQFGRLTVTAFAGYLKQPNGKSEAAWQCSCSCGTTVTVRAAKLRNGHTTSCGCYTRELTTLRNNVHGLSGHPLYGAWGQMITRCTNPNDKSYPDYGGRGITVCDRWRNSFEAFLTDMGERPNGMTLDRIDADGDYKPGNCRWATSAEQQRNKRNSVWLEYAEVRLPLTDWAAALGLNYYTLHRRVSDGWPVERALTEGVDPEAIARLKAEAVTTATHRTQGDQS